MGQGWYTVRLGSDPATTVTVAISASDSTTVTVSPDSVQFTSSNYGIPQNIYVQVNIGSASRASSYLVTLTHTASAASGSYSVLSATNTVTVLNVCDAIAYSWPSGTDCRKCMVGFDCTGDFPVACSAGYYNDVATSITCNLCPAGSECPNPTAAPSVCGSGFYSKAGAQKCTKCPTGMMCLNTDGTGMQVCAEGSYAIGGKTSCTACTAGNYCPTIHEATILACPTGWVSSAGAYVCTPCPQGQSCSSSTATPSPCTSPKFSLMGSSSCTTCPANMECIQTGPVRVCPEGSYAAAGSGACTTCPAGFYCSAANSGSATACTAGTYSVAGDSYCRPCPPGYQCPTPSSSPAACTAGTYSAGTVSACLACPTGTYSQLTGAISCTTCPAGFQCSTASALPVICPINTYSYAGATSCSDCKAGYMCAPGSVRPDPPGYECQPGLMCSGTTTITVAQCAIGSYYPFTGNTASSCFPCPPGKYCAAGTAVPVDCLPGFYCPSGTLTQTPCPAGSYNPNTGARGVGECLQCPEGYYCITGTSSPVICTAGNICPLESGSVIACPAGTYNAFSRKYQIEDCLPCPSGAYCPSGSNLPTLCLEGYYNPNIGGSQATGGKGKNCLLCPPGKVCNARGLPRPALNCQPGYYCPLGSIYPDANPCPAGTYSDSVNLYSAEACTPCPVGKACYPGTTSLSFVSCAAGYYCPLGTGDPQANPCPRGTYTARTDAITMSDCLPCPGGVACGLATNVPVACTAGSYCPVGTQYPTQYLCPAGTYSTATNLVRAEQCTLCTAGHYCPEGSTTPTVCPTNTYNDKVGASSKGPASTKACIQCPGGATCNGTGLTAPTSCGTGNYSPVGATSCTTCQVGYYCDLAITSFSAMILKVCPAGYFCPAGTSSNPYSDPALLCSVGYYCPEATASKVACPVGTYRNTIGAGSVSDCNLTPAGFYSDVIGTSDYTTKPCSAGYYCPAGSTSATQNACPPGTFRSVAGGASASDCVSCTAGLYCPTSHTVTGVSCPQGSYCPTGSVNPTLCQRGTYGASPGLQTSEQCNPCDAGKYCASSGLTAVTGSCQAGYYCKGGAYSPTPVDGATGTLCPAGGYCGTGATAPSPCPNGQYNNFSGAVDATSCSPCQPGYYCSGTLTSTPSGQCQAGYYCAAGSSSPTQNSAQAGYYAPQGSIDQIPCAPGTYNPSTKAAACLACPIGNYCPNSQMITATPCLKGFYCPLGTITPLPCPPGTYRDTLGAKAITECLDCTAGNYCNPPGAIAVTGQCAAGFFCLTKAIVDAPVVASGLSYGPCPAGSYCPLGSSVPVQCGVGTYNPSTMAKSVADCLPCRPGYACTILGKSTFSAVDQCNPGYYCATGSVSLSPPAAVCQPGYMCPTGSPSPIMCDAGTYQSAFTQSTCIQCPLGYYCTPGTGDYSIYSCPKGYYCPAGTKYSTQYPCAPGTYNDQLLTQDATSCKACPAGSYCSYEGAPSQTGSCAPGYFCTGSTKIAKPTSVAEGGGRCTRGYYCPLGSSAMIPCMGGFYCAGDQLAAPSGNCKAGYYCTAKAVIPTPTDGTTGDICPKGYYCPSGSSSPTACGTGTYLPYKGALSNAECADCIPGYYCDAIALITPVKPCPVGFYCPSGQTAPVLQCDKGYYCPAGSAFETKCPAGQYQGSTGQSSCLPCPDGYYCLPGTQTPVKCPKGFYCPLSTTYPYEYPCGVGTYNGVTGKSLPADCVTCDATKYCESVGLDSPTGQCSGGYYCPLGSITRTEHICPAGTFCPIGSSTPTPCLGGAYCNQDGQSSSAGTCLPGFYCVASATSPNPTDGTTGNLCQPGFYCPAATAVEIKCPAGTYSNAKGLTQNADCLQCPYGSYCSLTGLTTPTGQCDGGYYCSPGNTSFRPPASSCAPGYQCPVGSYQPQPCPMGTYTAQPAQAACAACPAGSFCLGGTNLPTPCPKGYYCPGSVRFSTEYQCVDGTYSYITGLSACVTCPAGYQCNNAATTATTTCAVYLYCPAGTGYGLICPPGSYNPSSTILAASTDCSNCPAGFYCVDGRISGQCEPGYYCRSGNSSPTPNTSNGYPCPAGYYCGRAATTPTPCPSGKFRSTPGARQITDCTDCPPGYYCAPSSSSASVPVICPVGNYCPQGSQAPIPCPIRRWNPNTGSSTREACVACPGGYLCTSTGIGDLSLTTLFCPPAYFCVEGAAFAVPCPPGTYRPLSGAASARDCLQCPGGNQCPGKTTVSYGCPQGSYCPPGSPGPLLCKPGNYCPTNSTDPLPCPSGSYCPKVTQAQIDLALILESNNCTNSTSNSTSVLPPFTCPPGTVCPIGSFDPQLCAPGRYVQDQLCVRCPAGTYSKATGSACQKCWAGFLCVLGATRPNPTDLSLYGGYVCPAGYYCGEGAVKAFPCNITTYNPMPGGTNSSACIISPANSYADQPALAAVIPCGSSAWSNPGSTTCQCVGAFRSYLKTDSSCRCLPGYEYVAEGVTVANQDATADCTPKAVTTCAGIRAPDGSCDSDCTQECASATGTRQAGSGLCVCSDVQDISILCNVTCRAKAPIVTLRTDGFFEVSYDGLSTLTKVTSLPGFYNSTVASGKGHVYSINMTTNGPQATYGLGNTFSQLVTLPSEIPAVTSNVTVVTSNSTTNSTTGSTARRLQSPLTSQIPDPVACITVNDTFMFSIPDKTHYPVYLKDSLLNTNLNFDYAQFLELERLVKSEASYVTTFGFTFTQEGLYDFADGENHNRHILVAVVLSNATCPQSAVMLTRTADVMTALGFNVSATINSPNWANIGLVMAGLVLLVLLIISGLYTYKWWNWTPIAIRSSVCQKIRNALCCRCFRRRVIQENSIDEDEPAQAEDLEASLFQNMFDKLRNHEMQLNKGFALQTEEAAKHLTDVLARAEKLRNLLEDKLSGVDPTLLRAVEDVEEEEEEETPAIQSQKTETATQKWSANVFSSLLRKQIGHDDDFANFKSQIGADGDLSEEDKKELLNDLNANLQRIENASEADRRRAQEILEQRLKDKRSRRRQAKNKVLDLEWQRQEMLKRHEAEKNLLKQQFQDDSSQVEKETGSEKIKIKREERQVLEKRLDELRSQLQTDLAGSENKEETADLMKSYELEARRVEQQLMQASQKHEQELLKRLEERRKGRIKTKQGELDTKLKELEARHAQELNDLTTAKAQIGLIDESADIPLLDTTEVTATVQKHSGEQEELVIKHEEELANLQTELEQDDLSLKKARLEQELAATAADEEKRALLAELEAADIAMKREEATQGDRYKEQLRLRRQKRAAKQLDLRQKQREEAEALELAQELEEENARHQAEMKRINDILSQQAGATPEELAALLRRLLDEKHEKELSELTSTKQKRLKHKQAELLSDQLELKANKLADIRSRFADLKAALEKARSKMTPEQYETAHNRLIKDEHEALQQMDFDFMADMNYGQSSNLESVEEEFRKRYMDMIQRQMQEVSDVLNRIKLLDWNLLQAHMTDARQDVVERQALIDKLYSEKMDDLEINRRRMQELQREKVKENEELEGNIKEVEDKQRKLAETESQRQRKLEEQQERLAKLRASGLSEKEINQIVTKYQSEMEEWEQAVERERQHQQDTLQKRLEGKKQLHQQRLQERLEAYKTENMRLLQQEPVKTKVQYQLDRPLRLFEPVADLESKLRLPGKEDGRGVEDVVDILLRKVRKVEDMVQEVDTKHFEQAMKSLKQLNELIGKVKPRR